MLIPAVIAASALAGIDMLTTMVIPSLASCVITFSAPPIVSGSSADVGLIEQHYFRLHRDRLGFGDALLLPTG